MKKIYVVEYCCCHQGERSEMFIDKIYAKRHTAEVYFSENYLECLRANKTTVKHPVHGKDLIDVYSYETLSGDKIYRRLREDVMIMD